MCLLSYRLFCWVQDTLFSDWDDIKAFYKKRIIRFYPLFFISSILLLLIHFNTWSQTWKGLIGLSPFWLPQQITLWYIATLMILYWLIPLLCYKRFDFFSKLAITVGFILFAIIIQILFHCVDPRLFYYYIVYTVGLFCAMYGNQMLKRILESKYFLFLLIPYILLLLSLSKYDSLLLIMGVGYMGVFVLLNISVIAGKIIRNCQRAVKIINFLSFGSMCAYLFHREIFWLLLKIFRHIYAGWRVDACGTMAYLFFIVLPIIFVSAYWIQKEYDRHVQRI